MGTSVRDQGIAPPPGAALLGNVAYTPPGLVPGFKRPFTYEADLLNIGSNASLTVSINVNNDSYFVVTQQTADIWDHATGNTTNTPPAAAPMTVVIQESSSGQQLMSSAVPIGGVFGTGSQPFVWLYRGQLWVPGSTIQITVTNRMGSAQDVRLAFSGFKTYGQPDQLVNL